MKLTPAQQTQIKKILAEYKREVNVVLKTHRTKVSQLVEDIDKKKMEKIKQLIQSS
jgi:hypothetical protein